jgi:hypothetical protein
MDMHKVLSDWIKSAEFRSIDNLIAQIAFFRAEDHKVTWETISILFQMPQTTLHRWLRRREEELDDEKTPETDDGEFAGPNSFLTNGEEDAVLQWVWDSQCERTCPTSPEIREFAANLRKQRLDDGRPCNRSWWHSFKLRHPELASITADSIENARCEVKKADVLAYFAELKSALVRMQTPAQLLNMDETGFCARPDKAKKKKVVYRYDCPVKPAFREQSDPNHVSLVATITLAGETLKPMFLTTAVPNFTDPRMAELASDIVCCRTAKGYQTHESMAIYLRDVLTPYCQRVRDEMNDQTLPIFLIMDKCGCHKKETLSGVYEALNIQIIWLPPHSSHFLQPLDLVVFAQLKMKYRTQQAVKTRPKWVSKIIRIHYAWHECTHRLILRAAWSAAAVIKAPSAVPEWRIDTIAIGRKLEEYCKQETTDASTEGADIRVPSVDDVLRWLAGIGPTPNQTGSE